jgi:hypothetical protein
MSQTLRKTLLIVCEGEGTEPTYFDGLRDKFINALPDYKIIISPKPRREKEEEAQAKQVTRRGGRSRQVKEATNKDIYIPPPIPEKYGAQPTRYVWEAQQGLIDNTYDEVWAVFDKDGHPDRERAFYLANQLVNEKCVNIAFSSISFETWVLMHYEYNTTQFEKSQCRTKKESHQCGQGTHKDDCAGKLCITGYLKQNGHVPKENEIKKVSYSDLEKLTFAALLRAKNLRQANTILPEYDSLSYTTVDRLVFKLLHLQDDFKWISIEKVSIHGLKVSVKKKVNILHVEFYNPLQGIIILLSDHLKLVNVYGDKIAIAEKRFLKPEDMWQLEVDLSKTNIDPIYLAFSITDSVNGITEIPA